MKGRLETKLKTEEKIERMLGELPEYVAEYYINFSVSSQAKSCELFINIIREFINYIEQKTGNTSPSNIEKYVGLYMRDKSTKIKGNEIVETSVAYQKTIYYALKSFCTYLYSQEIIRKNPFDNISVPKGNDKIVRPSLTSENIIEMIDKVDQEIGTYRQALYNYEWRERDKLILLLFAYTGMRKTALCEINIEDIDIVKQELIVTDKGHKIHKYNIKFCIPQLNNWLAQREKLLKNYADTPALFIATQRKRISVKTVERIVNKYSQEVLGYPVSPHKLRSAFCSILYEKTGDIEFVRDAVGHSNVATTQRYIRKNTDVKEQSATIMAEALGL